MASGSTIAKTSKVAGARMELMSDLTDQQLEMYRERLLASKAAIEALLSQTEADSRPVDLDLPTGRLTRIDAMQMQGMAQMNRHQLDIRRQQVEVALGALDAGNYGQCRSCKEPIGLGRIEVSPEAPFCLACQEMFER
jgi:DnaK suppressor protein